MDHCHLNQERQLFTLNILSFFQRNFLSYENHQPLFPFAVSILRMSSMYDEYVKFITALAAVTENTGHQEICSLTIRNIKHDRKNSKSWIASWRCCWRKWSRATFTVNVRNQLVLPYWHTYKFLYYFIIRNDS